MKKIEAIIRPSAFDRVKQALMDLGVHGMNYTEIKGFGRQHGHVEVYRGRTIAVDFLPKVRFEVVCHDEALERILKSILEAARTGGPEGPGNGGGHLLRPPHGQGKIHAAARQLSQGRPH